MSQPPPTVVRRPRPDSVEAFLALLAEGPDEPPAAPPGFRVRPDDVLIASCPKCGTTWLQQIVHGLRSGGAMDFEEISLVVPWIETAPMLGIDLNAPQVATPRAFKTHLTRNRLPDAGRKLFIVRDPQDALVSAYRFMRGVMFEPDAVDIAAFAEAYFLREGPVPRYWDHLRAWWPVRHHADVLFLCYEDLRHDLRGAVARIAAFCGIAADAALLDLATRQAGFDFMRAHARQFDDQPTLTAFMDLMRLPPARATKVRTGRAGDGGMELPAAVLERLAQRWREDIEAPLGIASYPVLRDTLAREAQPA
ncbi:sulfotransferase domain-containing protein [Thiohalocapsa sp. ML1]|uniref:sulfotransferase domain-containing protein n=1 Tax=Thiohalocapsa sp. ML1 TaxID=1431688 RepID=UPI000731F038|nr:sulfotransferase domain-containing protein [Thiohalocapsa sp. ML1]